jgi:DNA (cytosine-5)-methyltransferase 1
MEILKVGTTFSGIGAPEQALKNLKIPHVVEWACDIDKYAKETYFANHTCKKWFDDITKININELEYVDLYVFGFPCTDISNMGTQDLTRGKTTLVKYSIAIINKIKPKYILFENVKTLLAEKFKYFFDDLIHSLSKEYNLSYQVLNSKNYGVPQNRERIYCIGIRKDIKQTFFFPEAQVLTKSLKDILESNVSDFYLNKDKWYNYYNSHWKKEIGFVKINPDIARCLTTRDFYNYRGSFISPFNITNIKKNINKEYKETFTLLDKIRRPTERECARLQGFPESFIIPVNDKQAYKQFGNTITVTVLEQIFKNLLNYDHSRSH